MSEIENLTRAKILGKLLVAAAAVQRTSFNPMPKKSLLLSVSVSAHLLVEC